MTFPTVSLPRGSYLRSNRSNKLRYYNRLPLGPVVLTCPRGLLDRECCMVVKLSRLADAGQLCLKTLVRLTTPFSLFLSLLPGFLTCVHAAERACHFLSLLTHGPPTRCGLCQAGL